jgi:dihydroflavonol-4-reductase
MTIASRLTGKRKPLVVPPAMLSMTAFFTGLVAPFMNLPEMYHPEALRVQAGVTYLGDNSRAKKDLGYNPRPLETGLKQTFDYELEKMGK